MIARSRTPSHPEIDGHDDAPPDSTVRPTLPPEPDDRATPAPPDGQRLVHLQVRATPALLAGAGGYLTITCDGGVLFEGELDAEGAIEISVWVPAGAQHVRALLEAGSKYRNAIVALAAAGVTEHTFS